jgi:hypothetical protein
MSFSKRVASCFESRRCAAGLGKLNGQHTRATIVREAGPKLFCSYAPPKSALRFVVGLSDHTETLIKLGALFSPRQQYHSRDACQGYLERTKGDSRPA